MLLLRPRATRAPSSRLRAPLRLARSRTSLAPWGKLRKTIDPNDKLEWDKPAKGQDIFGSQSWKNNEEIKARTPMWAKVADSLLITTAAISVFGLIVAPIYNFLRYGINR